MPDTHPNEAPVPTFSMQPVEYSDGTFGVNVWLTGLKTGAQAEKAMELMQQAFCGKQFEVN